MRKLVIAAALIGTTALAAPAFAQDAAPSGLRVGVVGGYDIVKAGNTTNSRVQGDDQSIEGATYGVEAGYDVPVGNVVLGVEAEYAGSTAKTTRKIDPNTFGYGEVSAGRDIYAGVRVGVPVGTGTLLYAKGGYTNSRLNVLASDGTTDTRDKFDLEGWRAGAGVEKSLGRNTYAKVEYRYSNYNKAEFQTGTGATTNRYGVDTDRHQIVAGVGVRF